MKGSCFRHSIREVRGPETRDKFGLNARKSLSTREARTRRSSARTQFEFSSRIVNFARSPRPPCLDRARVIAKRVYHEQYSTDVVFGRRCRRMSLTQIVCQISVTRFELVKPVTNNGKG
ncbi:hypothetical protein EVAR_5786_1 [Eumeta japonica]|uniref:Uncharacterized protein n=1 Tax=Eumeta variegata TaxID=151549 RepID=A0A4C1T731_EUMVA|nr:hypothetical protein EVAR_5786_1 [Eumeta japonica]